MTEEKRKRGRPKKYPSVINNDDGSITVTDPFLAASMSRAPFCASAKDETPYPSNWDTLGKVAKLQWLTENRKK